MQRPGDSDNPTDAILTVPNVLTFARLALIPVFVWLALGPKRLGWAFAIGAIAGTSDFLDGKIARRLGQVSKLGIALDPLSDRLLIGAGAAVVVVLHLAPLWTVVLVVARDAAVLAAVPFLASRHVEVPPVNYVGKAAAMGVMGGFGFFLAAHLSTPPDGFLLTIAWMCITPGVSLSYISAAIYAVEVRRALASASESPAAG